MDYVDSFSAKNLVITSKIKIFDSGLLVTVTGKAHNLDDGGSIPLPATSYFHRVNFG